MSFSPEVLAQLTPNEDCKFYVYALSDTRTGGAKVFYVGKGTGNRCFAHAEEELGQADGDQNQMGPKLETIRDIRESGSRPMIQIIRHHLSEDEAFGLEAVLIRLLNLSDGLTNAVEGHNSQLLCLSTQEVEDLYCNPMMARDAEPGTLLVSLNRTFAPNISVDKLAQITLGCWPMAENTARGVNYVLGVYRGVVRAAYDVVGDRFIPEYYRTSGGQNRARIVFQGQPSVRYREWVGRSILYNDGTPVTRLPQLGWRMIRDV